MISGDAVIEGNGTIAVSAQFTLTIQVSGSGTTSPAAGNHTYDINTFVPVTAYPSSGWRLNNWTLDSANVGSANPYTAYMSTNHILAAVFTEIPSITASNNVRHNNSTQRTTQNGSLTLLKETKQGISSTGTIRVKFTASMTDGEEVYAQIYKNDSPIGTLQAVTTSSTEFSEDLGAFAANDLIQIYTYGTPIGNFGISVSDLTFCYDPNVDLSFTDQDPQ